MRHILDLSPENIDAVQQTAGLLVEGFGEHWPKAWPDMETAHAELQKSFEAERISRIVVDDEGVVLGWISGSREYDGHVWELHPLVVKREHQGCGIGHLLVSDFEEQVRKRGGLTIMLGTDDEDNMTSLAGIDLYPNVWQHIANIRNLRTHPYQFYQKLGFVIVGVIPDANGLGKPDILMAKRVAEEHLNFG